MAKWIPAAYSDAFLVTGYVDPAVARPDIPVESKNLGGHGWCMLKRRPTTQPDYKNRMVVVECTALTLSYRPIKHEESMSAMCRLHFGDVIKLYRPSEAIVKLPSTLQTAALLGLGDDGVPFKYKTVATVSTAEIEYAVCVPTTHDVGVDLSAMMTESVSLVPVASPAMHDLYNQ